MKRNLFGAQRQAALATTLSAALALSPIPAHACGPVFKGPELLLLPILVVGVGIEAAVDGIGKAFTRKPATPATAAAPTAPAKPRSVVRCPEASDEVVNVLRPEAAESTPAAKPETAPAEAPGN